MLSSSAPHAEIDRPSDPVAETFTAANGDALTATVLGQATRTGPTTLSIVDAYTITGGTGRFADATGSFTLHSTVDGTTGVSSGTFSGAIDHTWPRPTRRAQKDALGQFGASASRESPRQ
jgi:hypothetical protein